VERQFVVEIALEAAAVEQRGEPMPDREQVVNMRSVFTRFASPA
jgi:hypothetical protein